MFWNKKEMDNLSEKSLSQNEIREWIVKLQLPQIILQLFDGNVSDEIVNSHYLSDKFQAPYIFFNGSIKQLNKNYKVERYIPFLASYQNEVFAYDKITNSFIAYYIEHFQEDELVRFTWDGLFVGEIISWWEDEWSNTDIVHIGDLLGLKYTKVLINDIALQDKDKESNLSWYDWRLSLIKKIGGFVE